MVLGEFCNFAAYAFAPAILVTPLGAISIIVSAVLAHLMLNERLNVFGILGCVLCIAGSVTIVLHAPEERPISSVHELGQLALQPGLMLYALGVVSAAVYLVWVVAPRWGSSNLLVYVAICSIVGSLSVLSCKALGVAIKLTFEGNNQLYYVETYVALAVVLVCVITQMNYLNRALDLFNTAIVSPVYYVMFTTATIIASMIMYQNNSEVEAIINQLCGFSTIVGGTFLLHATKDVHLTLADLQHLTSKGGSLNLVKYQGLDSIEEGTNGGGLQSVQLAVTQKQ